MNGKRNVDQLAEMLELPSWERITELNLDNYAEARAAARERLDEPTDASEEEIEEAEIKAEYAAEAEVYSSWHGAILHAAGTLFEVHGLELVPVTPDELSYEFRITPTKSWEDAANKIRETFNGIGCFRFDSTKEFLDSGPYTARQAVLAHLGCVGSYPEVYGSTSAHSLYERGWR